MCSASSHRVNYQLFHLISFLVRIFSLNGQFRQIFWVIRPKKFSTRKSGGKACILRSERIIIVSKKLIFHLLYSYTHLVHSFVAETHCKLYISFIRLLYFDSGDLSKQKRSPNMWYRLRMIIRNYWYVQARGIGKF